MRSPYRNHFYPQKLWKSRDGHKKGLGIYSVDISKKSLKQIQEYVWKWYSILNNAATLEDKEKKSFIT